MKQVYLTLFFSFCLLSSFFAQNLSFETTVPNSLVVCSEADTFSVELTNISTDTLFNVSVLVQFPVGIEYVGGSIMGSASEIDVSQLDSIVLSVQNLAPGAVIDFSFLATALCASASNSALLANQLEVCFDGGCESHTGLNYNVDIGSLAISGYSGSSYHGDVGDQFVRCLTIRNAGLGAIGSFDWLHLYDGSMVMIDSMTIDGGAIATASFSGDSIGLVIDGGLLSGIGNGDSVFDSGEEFVLCYRSTILSCSNTNMIDTTRISYGCGGSVCSMDERLGNVTINQDIPLISATTGYIPNVCVGDPDGHLAYVVFENTGSGPAVDVTIDVYQSFSGSFRTDLISRFDETEVYWKNTNGVVDTLVPVSVGYNSSGGVYSCLGANPVGRMLLEIPRMEVGEVDTLFLRQYVCCVERCESDFALGVFFDFDYWDQCLNNNFAEPSRQLRPAVLGRVGAMSYDGPSDVVDGNSFSMALIHSSHNQFPQGANSRSQIEVVLPSGISFTGGLNDIQWVYTSGSVNTPFTYSYSGDTLLAEFYGQLTGEKAEFRLDLAVDCSAGVSSPSTIQYTLFNVTDTSCSCRYVRTCYSFDVSIHCPDSIVCPDGGMIPLGFEARRTNYGLPDNDNDGLPDGSGSLNMNEVRTRYITFGDTLEAAIHGVVDTSVTNPFWEYGYADLTISKGNRMDALNALVRIVDVSTGSVYSCALGAPTRANSGAESTFGYDFSVGSLGGCLPAGFQYEGGDTIELFAYYEFMDVANSGFLNVTITSDFYMTNMVNGPIYTCDSYTAGFGLVGYYFTSAAYSNYSLDGCGAVTTSHNYYLSVGNCCSNYAGGNIFRSEYRAWAWPDTFEIVRPLGYNWVGGRVNYYRTSGSSSVQSYSYQAITPLDPTADTLIFDVKSLFVPYGGSWPISDDGYYGTVQMDWEPSCNVANQQLDLVGYIWNFETVPQFDRPNAYTTRLVQNDGLFYAGPDMELSGIQSADGISNTVSWNVTLANNSNESDADNGWILPVSTSGAITVTEVRDTATQTVIPLNGVYELGSFLSGGDSRTFQITATYTSCTADSLVLYSGWNCSGYPVDLASYPCSPDSLTLYVSPQNSQLQAQLAAPSGTQVDLCDSIPFVLSLASTQLASIEDVVIDIVVPLSGGLSIVPDSSQLAYPSSVGMGAISNPSQVGNVYSWSLDSLSAYIDANGLEGSLAMGDSNTVQIRFLMETDCDFISGLNFFVRIRSNRPCGDALPTLFRASPPIRINGADVLYQTNISLVLPDTLGHCRPEAMGLQIVNIGPNATDVGDQIQCLLPDGLSYAGGMQAFGIAPSGNPSQQSLGTQTLLSWAMPVGVSMGDTIAFAFDIQSDTDAGCANVNVTARTLAEVSLSCNGSVCPAAVTQTGATTGGITIDLPIVGLDLIQADWTAIGGGNAEVGYSVGVQHLGGGAIEGVDSLQLVWYSDEDVSGDLSMGDVYLGANLIDSLAVGQSLSLGDVFVADTNNFGQNDILLAVVSPVGVGASCLCVAESDTLSPTILCDQVTLVCPNDTSLVSDSAMCGVALTLALPQIDSCPYTYYANDYNGAIDGSDFYPVGTHAVTWTAVNGLGDSAQCSTFIQVIDNTPPNIVCPNDTIVPTDTGLCNAAVYWTEPMPFDNCTFANSFSNFPSGTSFNRGTHTVTYFSIDGYANLSTCSFTIEVVDQEAPDLLCPSDVSQSADAGSCDASVSIGPALFVDNCPGTSVTNSYNGTSDASDVYPLGNSIVSWFATDASGNTNNCVMTVTILDFEAPAITCPNDMSMGASTPDCDSAQVMVPSPTVTDNCGSVSLMNDYTMTSDASATYPLGTTTVVWTATDAASNTASCSMEIAATDMQLSASSDTTICVGNVVDLVGMVSGGSGSYTYVWSDGSSIVGMGANVSVMPTASTVYTFIVDDGHCMDSMQVMVTVESNLTNPMACRDCWNAQFAYSPLGVTTAAPMYCDSANWTNYYDPANPNELLFSIEHMPNVVGGNTSLFTAEVELTATNNPQDSLLFNNSTIWVAEDIPNQEANFVLGRYWNVNMLSGNLNGTVNVRFFYHPEEMLAIQKAADRWLRTYDGMPAPLSMSAPIWFKTQTSDFLPSVSSPNPYGGTVTPVGIVDHLVLNTVQYGTIDGRNYVQIEGLSSFSGGTAAIRVSPFDPILPVELLSFDATRISDIVRLDWSILEDEEVLSYTLERSLDGMVFESMGEVMAQGQEGNIESYQAFDEHPIIGTNYYRLKVRLVDGAVSYSHIIHITFYTSPQFSLYPNPFNESVVIKWDFVEEGQVWLDLYNSVGQKVFEKVWDSRAAHQEELDMKGLPNGTYFYQIGHEGDVLSGKLMKRD